MERLQRAVEEPYGPAVEIQQKESSGSRSK
jgi:hypothetical protein